MAVARGWFQPQVLLAGLTLALLSACGGSQHEQGNTHPAQPLPTDTVTGTVTFKGKALPGAKVLLYSTNENVFQATATTDASGAYTFTGLGTTGNAVADWIIWAMAPGYGFYPSVASGANIQRGGCNNFLLGYNTGGIGLDVTCIHYQSLPNQSLTGGDFLAYDGSNPRVALPRTGQTTSYVAGDDAALQTGVAWPAQRFTDHQDGTVTDALTGLTWLKNASTFSPTTWPNALAEVNQLASGSNGLSDHSKPGDWRVPNLKELDSLLDLSASNPALPAGNPFTQVGTGVYWTSTPYCGTTGGATYAWIIRLGDGAYVNDSQANVMATSTCGVWAVKGSGGGAIQLQATGFDLAYTAGDDGTVQSGVHMTYPRWVANGNGTTTDTFTGLVWLTQADAINLPWAQAVAAVNALASGQHGLTDGSAPGSWRMPTRVEMQSLMDRNQGNHADFFDNTFYYADGTLYQPAVFTGFTPLQFYWTASTYAPDPTQAWTVYSCDFGVYPSTKANAGYTLAVR